MKKIISKYTLFEYLAGRTNPLERQLIEDWIAEKDNAETFHQWLLEYEMISPQYIPDQDKAIISLLQRLDSDIVPVEDSQKSIGETYGYSIFLHQKYRFWLIAASVILLVSCGWWFRDSLQYKSYQTAFGQTTDVYLEDGSMVSLNSNSCLKIPRFGFVGEVREVALAGEAEFSVSHTVDNKRFVVKTSKDFQVEVLGTTFSVYARPRGTKVSLKSGSVRIDYSQNKQLKNVMLEPGDLAFLNQAGEVQLERKQDVKTFAAWKEQRYVFNATSVKEIIAMIEENFGQKVTLSDSNIAERTITGNFKTKNADELLKTVSEVLDMKIEHNGNMVLLTNN
ncbi:FecR family protein [Dyadobacter arcticus]|uniref:Ferric-dicitrate binding protein FerR (Iron transport regulator) n=1 Tax=Dyadobacter arcticus TaxID=1078754 RepID=A0ABX0UF80_9BACT|nr:FecR domain-containing protein [Dyadobacter arcticus]NIJ51668.1 ferric-dicitrate binding protein FerR (iron transport regulator) [Dyadobacter arcticus]